MGKTKLKLPNKIIPLPNPDKEFHEEWFQGRNMLNFPHPFRACIFGKPNSGKTTCIKNIVLRAKPSFKEVVIIHCDGGYTKEYDDLGDVEILSEIPAPEDWEGLVKTLVILDDLEVKDLKKEQMRNLDRLFGYVSTHKNISVILTSQNMTNIPAIVRRCSNVFIMWSNPDKDAMAIMARKTGLKGDDLRNIFDKLMKESKDSLWVDLTDNSPYPMRKNGFTLINKN
jgi:uridine kinase